MKPLVAAASTCRPAAKVQAPPQRWGANRIWWAAASASIRMVSVMPPAMDRSGWKMSLARSSARVAEGEAGELAFAGRDGNVGRRADLRLAALVVRRHRLLQPADVAVGDRPAEPLRLRDGEGSVRVAHDVDVRPEALARGPHAFHGMGERAVAGPDTHLHGLESPAVEEPPEFLHDAGRGSPTAGRVGGHGGLAASADQLPDRPAEVLAENVPQGHVDPRYGRDGDPAPAEGREDVAAADGEVGPASVVHHIPKAGDVARILADQRRPQLVPDAGHQGLVGSGGAHGRLGLPEAGDPRIGLDPHQGRIEGARAAEVAGVLPILRDRHVQPVGRDSRDPHSVRPRVPAA